MTTTADKIAQIKRALENMQEWLGKIASDIERLEKEHNIKPPDPEPLQCWANIYSDLSGHTYATREEAGGQAVGKGFERIAIHMREVTPQDEQDRKDAARYRLLMKLRVGNYSNVGLGAYWMMPDGTRLYLEDPCAWSEKLDKAMEGK